MRTVFQRIESASEQFAERPLFRYLRSPAVSPHERLQFVPSVAHFVMTFADLYHFFLREEPAKDRFQELVNTHLSEEGTHWKWFLSDLTNLELDPAIQFTDALRLLWGDRTINTRRLAYEICRMSAGLTSLQKLVLVQAIEATGRVGLEAAVPVGDEVNRNLSRKLVYFGGHHLDTERQHTVEESSIRCSLEDVQLEEADRESACRIVDEVFAHFTAFVDETFEFTKRRSAFFDSVQQASSTHQN